MASLTRFKGRDGKDGPVSGALVVIPISFGDVGNSETAVRKISLPAGMQFELLDAVFVSGTVTSDPALTLGTTAAGTQIVAAVNVATNTGALTIKAGAIAAGGTLDARIVADAGDAVVDANLTLVGYVSAPPTSAVVRGGGHY